MRWRTLIGMGLPFVCLALVALGILYAMDWPQWALGQPWWAGLLLVLPVLVWWSYRPLGALGTARRFLALTLRLGLFGCLILALAELQTVREEESVTTIVLVDRSFSIPQEFSGDRSLRDERWERLVQAIKDATKLPGHERDRIGIVSFARQARLEYPASEVPGINIRDIGAGLDRNFTDIAAAIRQGLAAFPEGGARRLLLISDGNENRGDALAEARTAKLNGVPIDVVPIKFKYDNEILVERIDAPTEIQPGNDIPIRVVLRNSTNQKVPGNLVLSRTVGERTDRAANRATLEPGLNVLQAKWPAALGAGGGVMSYRAVFQPDRLPGDRADNNEAWAPVIMTSAGKRILFVVPDRNSPVFQPLMQAIQNGPPGAQRGQRTIDVWTPDLLPKENETRRFELSNYDTVVMVNLPADLVSRDQQEALRKAIRDQGTGLVMVGGPESFGAGRWQGEPLEEALPVDTAIKSRKVMGKGGLVLIMHASEMAEGNFWQKEVARLAINKLSPTDEIGIIYWNWAGNLNSGHVWHVPLQEIGPNRPKILRDLGTMQPGDMPQFDPAFRMAADSLTEPQRGISVKHVILVSDGDHGLLGDLTLLDRYRKERISLTTVGVTTHGPAAQEALAAISRATGGRHYPVDDPNALPAIYMKETRVLSQNFLYEKPFIPRLTGESSDPLREWTQTFPTLHGFVRTSRKESNLVQVLLRAPLADDDNPILAQWPYGLGRVAAFTSDAAGGARGWARDWMGPNNNLFTDFWNRVVDWSMRTVDDAGLSVTSRYENGKIRVTMVDNRDKEQRARRPLGQLRVTVASSTSAEAKEVNFEPVAAGVYEATVEAEAAGSYSATVSGNVATGGNENRLAIFGRSAVAVPYSPEFAILQDNEGLLAQIAQITGGRVIDEKELGNSNFFVHDGPVARRMQPVWHWLLYAAAFLLFFDIAVRRLAIDPLEVVDFGRRAWRRWRGSTITAPSQQYFDRLKGRKAAVETEIEKTRAVAKTFEPPPAAPPVKPVDAPPKAPPPAAPAKPASPPAPPPTTTTEDFATRLMKAKQKARERIEGDRQDGN